MKGVKNYMAKHNQVLLNGQVSVPPRIICDTDGTPIRAMCGVDVMHGTRDFGNNIDNIKYDVPVVMTSDEEMIKKVSALKKGDMVEVKGTITTIDIIKRTACKYCGHRHEKKGNLVCITPIYIERREEELSESKGKRLLRDRCEISNLVTVIAPLCRDPQLYRTENGTAVTTYQLAIRRKFRIKKDTDIRTDFPWVKSYGQIAENDAKSLRKGSYVFIDGRIQVRQLKRVQECEECGKVYEWSDSATEIVPYAVEYLRDYYTVDEIEAREREQGQIAAETIFSEDEIAMNRPTDTPDYKDEETEALRKQMQSDTASDILD